MVKVLFLGTRGFPNVQGGVEKHCENLTINLVKIGCDVTVFTRKPYVDTSIKNFKGVNLVTIPALKHKSLEAFLHTFMGIFIAFFFKPDILHIQAIGPSLFTPLARILGMKVVITSHGSNYKHLKWGKFARCVLRVGELLGVLFANKIIAISKNIADEIREKYNRDVAIIPNGVKIHKILESNETLEKYGLEKGKYILAVGRFVPEKGFHDLIEAFKQIQNSDSQSKIQNQKSKISIDHWKLVIVGRADHEDRYSLGLKEKTRENSNIVLTGFLTGEPLQELYSHAGLFVLPSYYEGLPIVLLEAMSYGLTCIASDIPSNRNIELSEDRFFNSGDVKALATKIKEFIDKPLSEEDRKKQIRMIAERYNWEKIAEKTLELYKIIGRSSRITRH